MQTKMFAGAKNFCRLQDGTLQFNFGRGVRRHMQISLNSDDTFTVSATRLARTLKTVELGTAKCMLGELNETVCRFSCL